MKKSLGPKNYIYPLPVQIVRTFAEDGTPNAMNIVGVLNAARLVQLLHKATDRLNGI